MSKQLIQRKYGCYTPADFMPNNQTMTQLPNGKFVPARPMNYQYETAWKRLKLAWLLIRRKIDALEWEGQ